MPDYRNWRNETVRARVLADLAGRDAPSLTVEIADRLGLGRHQVSQALCRLRLEGVVVAERTSLGNDWSCI